MFKKLKPLIKSKKNENEIYDIADYAHKLIIVLLKWLVDAVKITNNIKLITQFI